ncbi:DUF3060 domain-containing protein [Deinococcus deserti]|uniref:DUF3060 domain-containing protein n=1 Tax=Deinococcus deserti (strain DSM 17065 / CIP 109153 / LMG 22923 / VCD115) TaxID=546414 RepID=C1D251_DEIDV|nr:DUF3060 domain-containing protein [Deinococcus deserti]ACO47490.2 Hypothetical protein Deide_1p00850 [Deinococcus deserti VCD115]
MKSLLLMGLMVTGLAAAQTQGSATIRENGRSYTINCSGNNDVISVRGNHNAISLTGICENLVVYGNGNSISGGTLLKVWLRGNDNAVSAPQRTSTPVISNTGKNNRYSIGAVTSVSVKKVEK